MLCRTWCTWKFSARMILETPRKLKFLGGFTLLLNLQSTPTFGKKFMLVWSKVTRTHWWIGGVGCTTKHSCKDIVLYKTSYWTKMIYHYNIIWYYSYILNKNVPSIFCIIRTVVEIWKKKTPPRTSTVPRVFFSRFIQPWRISLPTHHPAHDGWSPAFCLAKDWKWRYPRPGQVSGR